MSDVGKLRVLPWAEYREKYTKYSHEKCSKETETAPPRGPPEDRLRLVRWCYRGLC